MVSFCHCLFLLSRAVDLFYTLLGPHSGVQRSLYTASNSNMNFESCNFREIKKIRCGSSRGLSQMVKVDECQDTIATQLGISHLTGLSEAELILSRAGHLMVICPQNRHKLGKFWRPPRSCQCPSHSGPRKKHRNERLVIGLETAKNIQSVFKVNLGIGSRKN